MTFIGLVLYQKRLKGIAVLLVKPISFLCSCCRRRRRRRRRYSFLSFFYEVRSCDLSGLRRRLTLILAGN